MIQGGDPQGDGTGGPGYTIVEAPPQDLNYTQGVVAMAKTETEPRRHVGQPVLRRHRRGRRAAARLRAARQGHQGQDVVDKIGVVQVGPDETPVQPIVIGQIRITES